MEQVKWFNRRFDFTTDQNIFPLIIERLRGTPVRLEEKIRNMSPAVLERRVGDTWSIKEHIGHLTDLEPLWQGRLEDILEGKEMLRVADLQNTLTNEADHNATPVHELLRRFRDVRNVTVGLLEELGEAQVFASALHPRLNSPMRTMDLFLFVTEHDDHHLVRVTELKRIFS